MPCGKEALAEAHRLPSWVLSRDGTPDIRVAVGLWLRPGLVYEAGEDRAHGHVVGLSEHVAPDASGAVDDDKARRAS